LSAGSTEHIYDTLYCARGQAENLIKMHLDAVEHVGEGIAERDADALKAAGLEVDLDAPRGLTAFFEWVALEYPQVACAMLARLMSAQQEPSQQLRSPHLSPHCLQGRITD
jgi:hypothetical protein